MKKTLTLYLFLTTLITSAQDIYGFIGPNGEETTCIGYQGLCYLNDPYLEYSKCNNFECLVAKNNLGGYFVMKFKGYGTDERYIVGNSYIFLDNGKYITLKDRDVEWKINGFLYSLHLLTPAEIDLLKSYNITRVRYKACSKYDTSCDSYIEYSNITIERSGYRRNTSRSKVDFPMLITNLYR